MHFPDLRPIAGSIGEAVEEAKEIGSEVAGFRDSRWAPRNPDSCQRLLSVMAAYTMLRISRRIG
jgi:hypothetical protein